MRLREYNNCSGVRFKIRQLSIVPLLPLQIKYADLDLVEKHGPAVQLPEAQKLQRLRRARHQGL
jgi:hypothetical protein